jgi:hypothetical protein
VADGNARAGPVIISGATGPYASFINGFYGVTEEKSLDGRLVLSKRGDPGVCIEHRGGVWGVKLVSSKGEAACFACVAGGCAFEDCASRVWRVLSGKEFNDQPSLKMAIESTGAVVFISCATGPCAAAINGSYDRTGEISGGYTVYSKRGDPSMCIEHGGGQWEVKPVSSKGEAACVAYVAGGSALEDCTSRVWKVWNGKEFNDQSSVKMATGREAGRQVSGGCMRALAHARDAAAPHPRARVSPCDAVRFLHRVRSMLRLKRGLWPTATRGLGP